MNEPTCDRWISLCDQAACGRELSHSDRNWLEQHAKTCPQCSTESSFWARLGSVIDEPNVLNEPLPPRASPPNHRGAGPLLLSRYGWALGMAAGVALTLSGALIVRQKTAPGTEAPKHQPARLLSIAGRVHVEGAAAAAGERLSAGQRIRTDSGLACVAIADSITTCLAENSDAELDLANASRLIVRLTRGRLIARLDKQPRGRQFCVETPQAAVTAKGTVFSVSVNPEHGTTINLHEGHVALQSRSSVTSAITAPARATIESKIETLALSDEAAAEDQRLLALSALPRNGQRFSLDVSTRPAGAEVGIDGMALGPTPVSAFVASGSRLSVSLAGYAPVAELLPRETGVTVERRFDLVPIETKATLPTGESRLHPSGAGVAASPSSLLARAQALRAQGKYAECAASYRQLISMFPRSDEARASLVSVGELQLSELGQPTQALQSFNGYLRTGGSLTREARYGKIRALQLLGRYTEHQAAVAEFVRDYPNSVQAATLRQRIQTKQPQ